MNLLHLKYFFVVAREQGYTNASKVLRIQQPALSRMVKILEENLGIVLFEKVGRNVRLTKAGSEVFEHCRDIFGSVETLKHSLGRIRGECSGPLLLGASDPIASHFLPGVLTNFLAAHPKVYPNVFSGPAMLLFDPLAKGQLEFGMFFHVPDVPEKLEVFETKEIRFHLVVKKELRQSKEVMARFIGSREIDDIGNKRYPTLERLRSINPEAKIRISSNNLTAHKELVLRGQGVSILPSFLIDQELSKDKLTDIFPKDKMNFPMKLIKRKTSILSNAATDFIKICLKA